MGPRRRALSLGLLLTVVPAGIVALLLDSETSGTGAGNVGRSGPEPEVADEALPPPSPS